MMNSLSGGASMFCHNWSNLCSQHRQCNMQMRGILYKLWLNTLHNLFHILQAWEFIILQYVPKCWYIHFFVFQYSPFMKVIKTKTGYQIDYLYLIIIQIAIIISTQYKHRSLNTTFFASNMTLKSPSISISTGTKDTSCLVTWPNYGLGLAHNKHFYQMKVIEPRLIFNIQIAIIPFQKSFLADISTGTKDTGTKDTLCLVTWLNYYPGLAHNKQWNVYLVHFINFDIKEDLLEQVTVVVVTEPDVVEVDTRR